MENPILQEIAVFAREKLLATGDYCGVASGPNATMLNSTIEGKDVKIKIEIEEDETGD